MTPLESNNLLAGLNTTQKQAVKDTCNHLLVEAGPGTGKTRVLTARILYLLQEGYSPDQILSLTFTNKAAQEIRDRLVGAGYEELPFIGTFHSWAYQFIANQTGRPPVLATELDQRHIVGQACKKAGMKGWTVTKALESIGQLKQLWPPGPRVTDGDICQLWAAYHELMEEYGLSDFDDLILRALDLLVHGRSPGFLHVLVDEFQDVSQPQYELLKPLAKDAKICAIGDPRQSIYGFRGASPRFLEDFKRDFSPVRHIVLDKAYRCPQLIIDAASRLFSEEGVLRSESNNTGKILHKVFENEQREANWIAKTIESLVGGTSFESINSGLTTGNDYRSLSEVCVLFRANFMADEVASALGRIGIPYQLTQKKRMETSKALQLLWHLFELFRGNALGYHGSYLESLGLSDDKLKELMGLSGDIGHDSRLHELLDKLGQLTGVNLDTEQREIFYNWLELHRQGKNPALFQVREQDLLDFSLEAVSLLTLHGSKGLEFPCVFIVGVDNHVLPWEDSDLEEEKRLFYVGLTRASERVFITSSVSRRIYGKRITTGPSGFLDPISLYISREEVQKPAKARKKTAKKRQKKLF